ncbi:hypothetical protein C7T35_28045 [Variovorax sp. WS11]|uniref:hypothetical protein n=1 Tax=Variovorax sp. WS11 TaxID=1105204 RepID=UPI000D0D07D7|nr:hypothetical protein [Variovorax sp. WS11]NDZ17113.1 hypothetical protein [Variovorax sp. WS11]PSL81275.1 hypothetical protein C7T35_28045 [Variovorax sp. WS11]
MPHAMVVPFQQWQFHLFIGERDFEGLTLGNAEVHKDGVVCFTFSLAGKAPKAAVQDVLHDECIAWVAEQEIQAEATSEETRR